jgi:hypothetical protein
MTPLSLVFNSTRVCCGKLLSGVTQRSFMFSHRHTPRRCRTELADSCTSDGQLHQSEERPYATVSFNKHRICLDLDLSLLGFPFYPIRNTATSFFQIPSAKYISLTDSINPMCLPFNPKPSSCNPGGSSPLSLRLSSHELYRHDVNNCASAALPSLLPKFSPVRKRNLGFDPDIVHALSHKPAPLP